MASQVAATTAQASKTTNLPENLPEHYRVAYEVNDSYQTKVEGLVKIWWMPCGYPNVTFEFVSVAKGQQAFQRLMKVSNEAYESGKNNTFTFHGAPTSYSNTSSMPTEHSIADAMETGFVPRDVGPAFSLMAMKTHSLIGMRMQSPNDLIQCSLKAMETPSARATTAPTQYISIISNLRNDNPVTKIQ